MERVEASLNTIEIGVIHLYEHLAIFAFSLYKHAFILGHLSLCHLLVISKKRYDLLSVPSTFDPFVRRLMVIRVRSLFQLLYTKNFFFR